MYRKKVESYYSKKFNWWLYIAYIIYNWYLLMELFIYVFFEAVRTLSFTEYDAEEGGFLDMMMAIEVKNYIRILNSAADMFIVIYGLKFISK